jgi:flagellar hook assembly protein FlgD
VINGVLATWDLSDIDNGDYTIRLTVNDTAGNVSIIDVHVTIDIIRITAVSATPIAIDPSEGEESTISCTIDRDANVTVEIYDKNDIYVSTVINNQPVLQGENAVDWDGRDDSTAVLGPEAYKFHIDAIDTNAVNQAQGHYRPSGGGDQGSFPVFTTVNPETFDPYQNIPLEIQYQTADPGRINFEVHMGGLSTPLIRQLLLDYPVDSELHSIYWDGRDENGVIYDGYYEVWTRYPSPVDLPSNPIIIENRSLDITDISAEAYLIVVTYGEISTVYYTLPKTSLVSIHINDPDGNYFRELMPEESKNQGSYQLEWHGDNDDGKLGNIEGEYTVVFTARDPNFPDVLIIKTASVVLFK